MPPEQTLMMRLMQLARRLTWLRLQSCCARTFTIGLVVLIVLLIAHRLYLITCPQWLWWALMAIAIIGATVWGYLNRATLPEVALEIDERFGLKERLSSALLLSRYKDSDPMISALITDAAEHSKRIDPRNIYPQRITRETRYMCAIGVIAILVALFMPEYPLLHSRTDRAVLKAIKLEGRKIKREARKLERRATKKHLKHTQRAARKLSKLGMDLEKGRYDKRKAMLRVAKLTDELKRKHEELARQVAPKDPLALNLSLSRLESQMKTELGQSAVEALRRQDMEKLRKLMEKLQRMLKQGDLTEEQREQIAGDLEKLSKELQKIISSLGGLQLELISELGELAKLLSEGNIQLSEEQLKKLAELLKDMQLTQADLEALKELLENLKDWEKLLAELDRLCPYCQGVGKG